MNMKKDEWRFLRLMLKECVLDVPIDNRKAITPRVIITRESEWLNANRAAYLLQKWAEKGFYDYGVTVDLGWITNNGHTLEIVEDRPGELVCHDCGSYFVNLNARITDSLCAVLKADRKAEGRVG